MIKGITILLNLAVFVIAVYLCITESFWLTNDPVSWFFVFILFVLPLLNICSIVGKKGDFISLYFKRKAMEEKKRISELEEKK